MADDGLLLGLDLGTSRIKAVLLDGAGGAVRTAVADTPLARDGDRVECPVADLLGAVAEVLAALGDERSRVVGVGLAGMAEGGAALGDDRRPVSPVISWNDGRGQEVVDLLDAAFGESLWLAIGQRLRTVSSVAKLGWLATRPGEPSVARWLGVPELVLHALTGEEATEHSLAARTGCWDVREGRWLDGVAAAAGFGLDVLPPVRPAGSAMGRVTPDGARWAGIPEGAAVTVAGHDHLAGMVGAGIGGRDLANSVGTAETVVGRTGRPPDTRRALDARVAVTVFPGPGFPGPGGAEMDGAGPGGAGPSGAGWALLASGARAGLVLGAASARLGRSPADLDDAVARAGGVRAGSGAALSGLVAELAAGSDAPLPDGPPEEVWGSLLDALVARTADAAERVLGVAADPGHPPASVAERVVVFGGGSTSRPWLAAKAAALGLPVWRSEVADAVARGAAVLAGVAAGWWGSADEAPRPPLMAVGNGPSAPGRVVGAGGPRA